jgi:hypothetical protein
MPKTEGSTFGSQYHEELEQLISQSLRENVEATQRGLNLVRTILSQRPQHLSGAEFVDRLGKFNMEVSRIITRHSQEASKEVLDTLEKYGILEEARKSEAATQPGTAKAQAGLEIAMSGRRGEEAKISFILANPSQKDMQVSFAAGDFVSEDGQALPSTGVRFSPDKFRLAPGQEVTVQVSAKINQRFKAGKIYASVVRLPEHPNKEISLKLQVLKSPSRPRQQPAKTQERQQGGKKKNSTS